MNLVPAARDAAHLRLTGLRLVVEGRVQAVGFRPFVYRIARGLDLSGWVRNRSGTVEIELYGAANALTEFEQRLVECAPPLARFRIGRRSALPAGDSRNLAGEFRILPSERSVERHVSLPPDNFMCDACRQEMETPGDRRYGYAFINCTECGPRYTLIRSLPYDRARTSMANFTMCDACRAEYEDPMDRRFHAEPLACPDCGPRLDFRSSQISTQCDSPLAAAIAALRKGQIVAIKGIGGYHLACDAGNETAVRMLRERKHRPDKPLAVMFPETGPDGLGWIRRCAILSEATASAVRCAERPIVLVPIRTSSPLARGIAPGLGQVGVFLPYSPLHAQLLSEFGSPLVMTSGNFSGEPVLTDNDQAHEQLAGIADAFLDHDRPIERPADDPVVKPVAGRIRPIRLGRGSAPVELELDRKLPQPVLALGAEIKNSIALAWDTRVVVSPHIGDMSSPRSRQMLAKVAGDLQRLYGVQATTLVCDAHPVYGTHRWAKQQSLPVTTIWHHHAHASALAGEYGVEDDWLVFAWDGVGFGEDGSLWGGETLGGKPGAWQRLASFRPFRLPGGDRAAREPWRSAAALCWEAGNEWTPDIAGHGIVREAWRRNLNCHKSTAAGRLFDAAACLLLGVREVSYEGQAPMQLEAVAVDEGPVVSLPMHVDEGGVLRADWQPLLSMLGDETLTLGERAKGFHLSLAEAIADMATALAGKHRFDRIGLTGGVFQNDRLATAAVAALARHGFVAVLPERLPCNDAGLGFGQIIEHSAVVRAGG